MVEKAKVGVTTAEETNARLRVIGRKRIELERIEGEMQLEIDAVKARYSARLEERRVTLFERIVDLRVAVEDNRAELLPKARKSLKLLFGVIGFRSQGDRLKTLSGVSAESAAMRLRECDLEQFVRTRLEPDKQAIKEALKAGQMADRLLREVGLRLVPGGEDFYYDVDRVEVEKHWDE